MEPSLSIWRFLFLAQSFIYARKKRRKRRRRRCGSRVVFFFINDLPLENEGSCMAHKPRKQFDSLIPEGFQWSYYHPQPRYEWKILSYWWGKPGACGVFWAPFFLSKNQGQRSEKCLRERARRFLGGVFGHENGLVLRVAMCFGWSLPEAMVKSWENSGKEALFLVILYEWTFTTIP